MNKTLFFTGLSGSGKTTLALALKDRLDAVLLDGDILRKGLNKDLCFSREDRCENIRRVIELCKLFNVNGRDVIAAFICPYEDLRKAAQKGIDSCFIIYCECSIEECERRDPKGLYKKARARDIKYFTGISSVFEKPKCANIIVNTEKYTVDECVSQILLNVDNNQHLCFIGRWHPLHEGHKHIMKIKYKEKGLPLLILVRDTHEAMSAYKRKHLIEKWFAEENIQGKVVIIPDIEGVYYGRGVGYNIEQIEVPKGIADISGTKIREGLV